MNSDQRALYRAAEAVRNNLRCGAVFEPFLHEARWNELQKLLRQLHLCKTHGFSAARKCIEATFESSLSGFIATLNSQLNQLRVERPKLPSIREIYEDLFALRSEFAEVQVDPEAGTISATTEPVTLRGIDLGPFEIRFFWRELGERAPYRVVALEPNPAATNDSVTHPHVQDESLCEGDGREAIEAALSQGRIADFFLVVSQVLHTYAQGQAYVELARWQGTPCSDCGDQVDDDDRYACDRCDVDLCGGCSLSCRHCERGFCSDCLTRCDDCEQPHCESCLTTCSGCERQCCQECLDERLCSACRAEEEEENDDEEECHEEAEIAEAFDEQSVEDAVQRNRAEVQPDGLGEAALPA